MRLEISVDDGSPLDLRTADLLRRYQLPAVFYVPNCSPLTQNELARLAVDFELGGHTVTHPADLKALSWPDLEYEISENKAWLERLIGKPVTRFCYPRGRYNPEVVQAVKSAGFTEARTTVIGHTDWPENCYQHHTTVHAFQRPEYKGEPWLEYAMRKLAEAAAKPEGYFHLWFHSWEVDRDNNWEKLETLLKLLHENLPQ